MMRRLHSADLRTRDRVLVGLAAVLITAIVAKLSAPLFAGYPATAIYLGVAIAWVVWSTGRRTVAAIEASLAILLLAESALAPTPMNVVAPGLVVAVLGVALILERRVPSARWVLVLPLFLAVIFVLSTFVFLDQWTTVKAVGVALMWLAVTYAASTLQGGEQRSIALFVVGAGVVSSVVAFAEGPLQIAFVRDVITPLRDHDFVNRPNTILGDWTIRTQATLGYPIILGVFLALGFVAVLVIERIDWRVRAGAAVVLAAGIASTGARSAVFAVAVGIVVFAVSKLVSGRRRGVKLRSMVVEVSISVLAVAMVGVFFVRALAAQDLSLFHRSAMIDAVWADFLHGSPMEMLIGRGYGAVDAAFAAGAFGPVEVAVVDNQFAWLLVTAGALGVASFCAWCLIALVRGDSAQRALVAAAVSSLFFVDGLGWHVLGFMVFLVVAQAVVGPSGGGTALRSQADVIARVDT